MAKTLAQFATDIRGYVAKGKVKAARKSLDKAVKSGHKGPQLKEVTFEVLLAEGGGTGAAQALVDVARSAAARLAGASKTAEAHLRQNKEDHVVRDALWEICLGTEQYDTALKHAQVLCKAGAIDPARRGKLLLDRKDAVGATGIFFLATLGAIKTDRIKLADKLLGNETGARILAGVAETLHRNGFDDGPVHYVLAQLAKKSGDREKFLEYAGKAFEENPEEVWTWTVENVATSERLEIALRQEALTHLLEAADKASPADIVGVAEKTQGEGTVARTLRGLALLLQNKAPNACRVLEKVVAENGDSAGPIANFLHSKGGTWPGAHEVFGAVVATALAGDAGRIGLAAEGILEVDEAQRREAWGRAAPRLLEAAPEDAGLRRALGFYLMGQGDQAGAADLLTEADHIDIARDWAESGKAEGPVLLAAAGLAEDHGRIPDSAEWLLRAAKDDGALLAELGDKLSGTTVSADTALTSASALLDQGAKEQAAKLLERLPLDPATGGQLDGLLKQRRLHDDRAFMTISFRCALALGDGNRARRLFKSVPTNVQVLAKEAAQHANPGRVLADVLIGQDKGEVAVGLLEARRAAGDDTRHLLPLADALLKAAPRLGMGRLVRAKILQAMQRDEDAVRDLRAIPFDAGEADEAFKLLGELAEGPAAGAASLGRADIHVARKDHTGAVLELAASPAPAAERLQRYEMICREKADLDAAWRGRATSLLELGRVPEAADSHMKRFHCADADPAAVGTDLEDVARKALEMDDLKTAGTILENLPEQVSDGAERAIGVIGDDQRASMLILLSKLLLQLARTEEAVTTLSDLVAADKSSRPQAAKALEAIVDSGQARPEADFALSAAFHAMEQTSQALNALSRLYADDITSKDNVVKAAEKLVRHADDPDVRLFLGRVCLDMRDPHGATEHAIHARRLRPAARRDCVALLQRALDLDAFAPETHFALAEAHLAGDEADDAVRHFRAAVEVDKSRSSSAIAAMEEAAPRSKHTGLLWLAVGTTHAEFGKEHASAVQAFTKGLETDPTTELRVLLLLGRGDSYAALREDDHAFDDFDEASQHDELERRYYEFLRARHRKRVLEAAEAAREMASKDFAYAAEACGRFIRLGRASEAVDVAQAALAAAPLDLGPRYLVGVALHGAGRFDAAAQVLEAVRASTGADTDAGRATRMLLAESYLDQGDRARARACLTEIEALDNSYPGLQARRAALAPPADDPHAPPPLFVRPEFPRPTE